MSATTSDPLRVVATYQVFTGTNTEFIEAMGLQLTVKKKTSKIRLPFSLCSQ